ncbi:helix-turn-helix transcriptional regulator [Pedobacter metabolipauper]|uniref:Regulatory LuxR family protein n=1 Tax=Pedobacter metabolipauper TaxID=425513 RepID=A0A4R6T299_9SPHI|nr:LuxR C-terminal-related transcriptional regulator [Pedobacter metabolipauper]TDQ12801.1 regulatory LuxR family protein [Pedobacter metabolipauper]
MLQNHTYPAFLPPPFGIEQLTPMEREIVKRSHLEDKIIADSLNISYHTVTTHNQNIRRKTGLQNKGQVNRWYSSTITTRNDKVN